MVGPGDEIETVSEQALRRRRSWHRLSDSRLDAVQLAFVALWVLPFVTSVARAVRNDWYPVGDQALIAIRARDVLTEHHPLLGTAASVALGENVLTNHPGPMLFDLVALPVRLFGPGAGLVIGTAAINVAAGILAIVFGARRLGRQGAALVTIAFAALACSVGSEALYDPYNPTISMFPFLTCLVLAWAAVDGDRAAPPWLFVTATFCIQTNLAYVIVVLPLVAVAVGWFAIGEVRRSHADGAPRFDHLRRPAAYSGIVLVVLWAQPLLEQLAHGGDGNMVRLLRATRYVEPPLGWVDGTRRIASVAGPLGQWMQRSMDDYSVLAEPPSFFVSLVTTLALILVLMTSARVLRRRGEDTTSRLAAFSAITLVVAWLAAMRVPLSPLYGFSTDYVRWLWPSAAFAWSALLFAAIRLAGRHLDGNRVLVAALVAVTALSVGNVPRHISFDDHGMFHQIPFAVALNTAAVDALPPDGVVYHPTTFYPTFGLSLLAAVRDDGIPFWVDDPVLVRQFGESRRADLGPGDLGTPTLEVAIGFDALDRLADGSAVAFVSELSAAQIDELHAATSTLAAALAGGDVGVSASGERILGTFLSPEWLESLAVGGAIDAPAVARSEEFASLLGEEVIDVPGSLADTVAVFLGLRTDLELSTAAVLVVTEEADGGNVRRRRD